VLNRAQNRMMTKQIGPDLKGVLEPPAREGMKQEKPSRTFAAFTSIFVATSGTYSRFTQRS
jgi:hypothetical protein